LRTLRRALLVRIVRMLRQRYREAEGIKSKEWHQLETFLGQVNVRRSAFISTNWDTVIEEGLSRTQGIREVDYGCDAQAAEFRASDTLLRKSYAKKRVQLLKLHGSTNWLYCDNCRSVFWFRPDETLQIANQLFRAADQAVVQKITGLSYRGRTSDRTCPRCEGASLGTRLATFSYRKALDFPMFQRSWLSAEQLLREADTWVFIGYSLPPADYEFKYLLKRVQLSRKTTPRVVLVTGGRGTNWTYENYQRFFGRVGVRSGPSKSCFFQGLNDEVITFLKAQGALGL
jgi:hypothetical protein